MQIKAVDHYEFVRKEGSGRRPGVITAAVRDWYDNKTERYLIFEAGDAKKRRSVYNTIYAMSKRRGNMNIIRHLEGNNVILERM